MTVISARHQPHRPVGDLLREWRQLDLAIQTEISALWAAKAGR